MGGPLIHHELVGIVVVYENGQEVDIFEQEGSMGYFRWLEGFDTDIVIDFEQSLHGSVAWLRGVEILVIEESVARMIGFPAEGEQWFNHRVDYTTLRNKFIQGTNE